MAPPVNIISPEVNTEITQTDGKLADGEENKVKEKYDEISLEGLSLFDEPSLEDKVEDESCQSDVVSLNPGDSQPETKWEDNPDQTLELNAENISESLSNKSVMQELSDNDINDDELEVKVNKMVSIESGSDCFSDQIVREDLAERRWEDRGVSCPGSSLEGSRSELDPGRFVSYPEDMRPSYRLPQRLTSRRSTMFLQRSLCCCQRTREVESDGWGWTSLFCCLRNDRLQ